MGVVTFTAEEEGFVIEADGRRLRISYDECCGDNHEEALALCRQQGGGDESVENLRFIARYRDFINTKLKEMGGVPLAPWYCSNEVAWWDEDCVFSVYLTYGYINHTLVFRPCCMRAIKVL